MIKQCVICHKDFECKKSTAKYCSRHCENEARKLRILQKKEMKDVHKTCLICGKEFQPKSSSANQRTCCYECMPEGQQLKRGDFLAKIKQQRGGYCQKCGYNKCLKALEFHHLNPSQKDFTISNDHFRLKDAIEESKKCILICANCHRELHDGLWKIEDIMREGEVNLGINS